MRQFEVKAMNLNQDNQIYIRLLEGVEVLVPVKATLIESSLFRITENQYLDFEDETSIWEFFPDDVVECEFVNDIWIARKLVESSIPDRELYQLIFHIVDRFGNVEIDESNQIKDTINELHRRDDIIQKQHPVVENWLEKQKSAGISKTPVYETSKTN